MTARSDAATKSSEWEFVITRVFDAPREIVWKAWTESERLAQWWGPHGFTNPVCEVDLRPGGAYRIVMRSPEGVGYPLKGVYLEIVESERLVMTIDADEHPVEWHDLLNKYRLQSKGGKSEHGLKLVLTVTFEEHKGKTKLTILNRFASAADRDAWLKMGATEGWSQSLERLEELIAKA